AIDPLADEVARLSKPPVPERFPKLVAWLRTQQVLDPALPEPGSVVLPSLERHAAGDWGDYGRSEEPISGAERWAWPVLPRPRRNQAAIEARHGLVVGKYPHEDGAVWIITSA